MVTATRDSVGMADDVGAPHERRFRLAVEGPDPWHRIRDAIRRIGTSDYLPYSQIWLVRSGARPVAIIAERWPEPMMVEAQSGFSEERLERTSDGETSLHFTLQRVSGPEPGPELTEAYDRTAERLLEQARDRRL